MDWRPTASVAALRAKAELLRTLRGFLDVRGYYEVCTPLLSADVGVDPHIGVFRVPTDDGPRFLQTSPEFAMKRLLAAGSGSIYEITRSFRSGEIGARHNPEFLLAEWYCDGGTIEGLMEELDALGAILAGWAAATRLSYTEAFRSALGIDPLTDCDEALADMCRNHGGEPPPGRDDRLNLLLALGVEPWLARFDTVFIHSYPASQAALAELDPTDPHVARRFEWYARGVELANGYQELGDPVELRDRIAKSNLARRPTDARPTDSRLLDAMAHGLPPCAGVALGVDRLAMVLADAADIAAVLPFPWDRV